jgi:endoglucanase
MIGTGDRSQADAHGASREGSGTMTKGMRNVVLLAAAIALAIGIGMGVAQLIPSEGSSVDIDAASSKSATSSPSEADDGGLRLPGDMYADPETSAGQWVKENPDDPRAESIEEAIVAQPTAVWFGEWSPNLTEDVGAQVAEARDSDRVAVLVTYESLVRGCENPLTSTKDGTSSYLKRSNALAQGIGEAAAIVLFEPGNFASLDCSTAKERTLRLKAIGQAVKSNKKLAPNALTYVDAGPVPGKTPEDVAEWLDAAGLRSARGFALNVAGYRSTDDMVAYADSLNEVLESKFGYRKPYVIDTSRNGAPGDVAGDCNPGGVRIGDPPRTASQGEGPELFVWAKVPGESDGGCGQAPNTDSGEFVPEMAAAIIGEN